MRILFRSATEEDAGDDWFICFGEDVVDGKIWYVTTDHVHASEYGDVTKGARLDAELIAKLLNEYYAKNEL